MELQQAIDTVLTVRVSPPFAAMLDYALDAKEKRIQPEITGASITSDGYVMVWTTDRPDKEGLLGTAKELEENIWGLCRYLEFETKVATELKARIFSKIKDWRR